MKRRVLVLGASSLIGRRVLAALETAPWAVAVAARHRSPPTADGVETVRLDAADEIALARAVASVDAVVNCITGSAATLTGTARALGLAAARAPFAPRVVHLSTMAVYGSAVGTVDEITRLKADGGVYAVAQVEAEQLVSACGRAVMLRPGCLYGPGSVPWSERIARWLAAGRIGDLGAAGDGLCNLVYVNDVVAAILAAVRVPRIESQAFNLASPVPLTWNEYFLAFARALGAVPLRRISRRRLALETRLWAPPLRVAELTAGVLRLSPLRVPPPMPSALLGSWSQQIRLDVRKAQQILGVAWTPIEAGLRETAAALGVVPWRPTPALAGGAG